MHKTADRNPWLTLLAWTPLLWLGLTVAGVSLTEVLTQDWWCGPPGDTCNFGAHHPVFASYLRISSCVMLVIMLTTCVLAALRKLSRLGLIGLGITLIGVTVAIAVSLMEQSR